MFAEEPLQVPDRHGLVIHLYTVAGGLAGFGAYPPQDSPEGDRFADLFQPFIPFSPGQSAGYSPGNSCRGGKPADRGKAGRRRLSRMQTSTQRPQAVHLSRSMRMLSLKPVRKLMSIAPPLLHLDQGPMRNPDLFRIRPLLQHDVPQPLGIILLRDNRRGSARTPNGFPSAPRKRSPKVWRRA